METNIVNAFCGSGRTHVATRSVFQHDYGLVLDISGIELPSTFEAHFCNEGDKDTKTVIGWDSRVAIPDEFLVTGKNVFGYLYLHTEEDDGETVIKIYIPVVKRAKPIDEEITPQEHSAISDTIAALNRAVERSETNVEKYPKVVDGYWYVWDAETGDFANTNQKAQAELDAVVTNLTLTQAQINALAELLN